MNKRTYFERYCDIAADWKRKNISIDDVKFCEYSEFSFLLEMVIKQTGMTENEINLIRICREKDIFTKVNTCMFQLIFESDIKRIC